MKYLPIFYRVANNTTWGKTVGPFVYLPEGVDKDSVLAHHERWHVKQFYFLLLVVLVSLTFPLAGIIYSSQILVVLGAIITALDLYAITSKKERISREAAAYGESVRVCYTKFGIPEEKSATTYAELLAGPVYNYGITVEDAKKMILDKAGSYTLL